MSKIILPEDRGVPNLEIRRMRKELEATRPEQKIHPQTAAEISKHLDRLQDLTQKGQVRAMTLVALLTRDQQPTNVLTLFGAPNQDKGLAAELITYSAQWLAACQMSVIGPDKPPEAS